MRRERGTLAHFGGGEGIYPDEVLEGRRQQRVARAWYRQELHHAGRVGAMGQYAGLRPGFADPTEGREAASHRGRGPKDYVRPDSRIREEVCERLSEDPWVDASDIEVQVENGEVTLEGTVAERGARRLAGMLAEVSGVRHVQNNLRVNDPGDRW